MRNATAGDPGTCTAYRPEIDDPWLRPWLPLIAQRAAGKAILELGCGEGRDTRELLAAGQKVVAIDHAAAAIERARNEAPNAVYHQQDLFAPLPVAAGSVPVVIASLSLHYFPWEPTRELLRRIAEALQPQGLLLCRVNSVNDHNHGASGHPQIAENYYLVNGRPKRFFDRDSLTALLAEGWKLVSIREQVIHRYRLPKSVWEVVAQRSRSTLSPRLGSLDT